MLNLEIYWDPGYNLGLSVQRGADHAWFDFTPGVINFAPVLPPAAGMTTPAVEASGLLAGVYRANYGPTPGGIWWDGDMIVGLHDLGSKLPDGTVTTPKCLYRFAVSYAKGNSMYLASPYFLSY